MYRWQFHFILLFLVLSSCTVNIPNKRLGPLTPPDRKEDAYTPTTHVPVAIVSNTPSRGLTWGGANMIIIPNKKQEVQNILSGFVTFNKISGVTPSGRLIAYGPHESELKVLAQASSGSDKEEDNQTDHRLSAQFKPPLFGENKLWMAGTIDYYEDGTRRFYGYGPNTKKDNEANHAIRETLLKFRLGYRFNEEVRLSFSPRYSYGKIDRGGVFDLPFSETRLAANDRISSYKILSEEALFEVNTRNPDIEYDNGTQAQLSAEFSNKHVVSDTNFEKYRLNIINYYPLLSYDHLTIFRIIVEHMNGNGVPFPERLSLGGPRRLRAFPEGRFVDKALALLTLEQRFTFLYLDILKYRTFFEIAPFVEWGMVESGIKYLQNEDAVWVGGGFRVGVRPNFTFRCDLGFSEKENSLFLGVDYPL